MIRSDAGETTGQMSVNLLSARVLSVRLLLVAALLLGPLVFSSRAQQEAGKVATSITAAQIATPPDNDAILRATIDSDSPYYYPALKLRYDSGDTTLGHAEYYHLYYGFAYRDEYRPLEPVDGETQILTLLEKDPEQLAPEDAREILYFADKVMLRDPFSPRNINFMIFAAQALGDTLTARVNADKLDKILRTIESSGTGLKESSPWHILWFSHAADLLAAEGLDINKRQVRSRTVEYIMLAGKIEDGPKGYFFDFSRIYWKKPDTPGVELPKNRRSGGWDLNGIRIGGNKEYTPPR